MAVSPNRNFFLLSPLNWAAELPSGQSLVSIRIWIWASEPTFYKAGWQHTPLTPALGNEMMTVSWVSLASLICFNDFQVSERPRLKRQKWTVPEERYQSLTSGLRTRACLHLHAPPLHTHTCNCTRLNTHKHIYIHVHTEVHWYYLHLHLRLFTVLITNSFQKLQMKMYCVHL